MNFTWRVFAAACLFSTLLFFATDKLIETPPTWFDEGLYLQAAMNDSLHGAQKIQVAPDAYTSTAFITGGFPFLKPISWVFSAFGIGLLQARIVMVGFILVCAATFFLLTRKLFGWNTALMSLALLVTFPPLYGQGKNALGEVPGLFYLATFFYAISELEKRKFQGTWWYVLAGIAAGLCVTTKPIFFLLGGAVIVAAIFKRYSIEWHWKSIAIATVAFLVPFAYWFAQQFFGSDSASTVLGYYANPYAINDINTQIITNFLRFFTEASPLYFAALMTVWTLAIGIRLYRKESISVAETIAFSFAILVSLAYLRTAGWYRYFFTAEIVSLLFIPHALHVIAKQFKRAIARYIPLTVIALLVLTQSYQLLFTSWVAAHGARTTSHDLQTYINSLPKDGSFFVYNMPAVVIFLPSQNYYQYVEVSPGKSIGDDYISLLAESTPDYLIISGTQWVIASSTYSHYSEVKNIDGIVFAKKR